MRHALVFGLALVGCGSSGGGDVPVPLPVAASTGAPEVEPPHAAQAPVRAEPIEGRSAASVTMGKATVPASLDAAEARKVLRRRVGYARMCYSAALADEPGLKGTMVVRLTVDANGEVEEVGVPSASLKNLAIEDCLERGMKGLRFSPPTKAPAMVDVPLTFTLGAAAK